MRTSTYKIQDTNLAAAIEEATGEQADIIRTGDRLVTYAFNDSLLLRDTVIAYSAGLMLNAKRLLNTRQYLLRRVKGGAQ